MFKQFPSSFKTQNCGLAEEEKINSCEIISKSYKARRVGRLATPMRNENPNKNQSHSITFKFFSSWVGSCM